MSDTTIFICSRGAERGLVKVQLEVPKHVLEKFKEEVKGTNLTAKRYMEIILASHASDILEFEDLVENKDGK